MKRLCIYGKGGIGKSTVASNVAASLAGDNHTVMVIGCDPKADTTRNLVSGRIPTILNTFWNKKQKEIELKDIVFRGFNGVYCAESGGPEPGVGCAGRGVITAVEILSRLKAFDLIKPDIVIYDVLGDVVCGGFAMPLKNNLADNAYIVTTCDPMAIYAANNICKGIRRFAIRGQVHLGGLIYNGRCAINEPSIVAKFADMLGTKVIGKVSMSTLISKAEMHHKTVVEYAPTSDAAQIFHEVAQKIYNNVDESIPKPLSDEEIDSITGEIDLAVK